MKEFIQAASNVGQTQAQNIKQPHIVITAENAPYLFGVFCLIFLGYIVIKIAPGYFKKSFQIMFKEVINKTIEADDSPAHSIAAIALEKSDRFKTLEVRSLSNEKRIMVIESDQASIMASHEAQIKLQKMQIEQNTKTEEKVDKLLKGLYKIAGKFDIDVE